MNIGVTEILVVLVIVLIIFGAGKLPNVMGDLAKGIRNFKSGLKDEPEAPVPPPQRVEARAEEAPAERPNVPTGSGGVRP